MYLVCKWSVFCSAGCCKLFSLLFEKCRDAVGSEKVRKSSQDVLVHFFHILFPVRREKKGKKNNCATESAIT